MKEVAGVPAHSRGGRRWLLPGFLVLFMVWLPCGCAQWPNLLTLNSADEAAGRDSFRKLVVGQGACDRAIDAEATVTLELPWQSGTITGYLQLMAPGYLKFIGLNPLGQPLLLLGSDGADCRYVLPAERKIYQGRLGGIEAGRYIPAGFDPTRSYYWLIGRLRPGKVRIGQVSGDPDGAGIWVKFRYEDEEQYETVLFDPRRLFLLRHQLLAKDGHPVLEISYADYTDRACPLPGQVVIHGDNRFGRLVLRLGGWLPADGLTAADFTVTAPSDFLRINIK